MSTKKKKKMVTESMTSESQSELRKPADLPVIIKNSSKHRFKEGKLVPKDEPIDDVDEPRDDVDELDGENLDPDDEADQETLKKIGRKRKYKMINNWLQDIVSESELKENVGKYIKMWNYECILCHGKRRRRWQYPSQLRFHLYHAHLCRKTRDVRNSQYFCPEVGCEAGFSKLGNLNFHMREKHPKDGDAERLLACETCGKLFGRQDMLEKHEVIHAETQLEKEKLKKCVCSTCGHKFVDTSYLLIHLQKIHNLGELNGIVSRKNQCQYCHETFHRIADREAHIIQCHGNQLEWLVEQKRVEDEEMRFIIENIDNMEAILRVKPGEYSMVCSWCGHKFKVPCALRKHCYEKHMNGSLVTAGSRNPFTENIVPSFDPLDQTRVKNNAQEKRDNKNCRFCGEKCRSFVANQEHTIREHPDELDWLREKRDALRRRVHKIKTGEDLDLASDAETDDNSNPGPFEQTPSQSDQGTSKQTPNSESNLIDDSNEVSEALDEPHMVVIHENPSEADDSNLNLEFVKTEVQSSPGPKASLQGDESEKRPRKKKKKKEEERIPAPEEVPFINTSAFSEFLAPVVNAEFVKMEVPSSPVQQASLQGREPGAKQRCKKKKKKKKKLEQNPISEEGCPSTSTLLLEIETRCKQKKKKNDKKERTPEAEYEGIESKITHEIDDKIPPTPESKSKKKEKENGGGALGVNEDSFSLAQEALANSDGACASSGMSTEHTTGERIKKKKKKDKKKEKDDKENNEMETDQVADTPTTSHTNDFEESLELKLGKKEKKKKNKSKKSTQKESESLNEENATDNTELKDGYFALLDSELKKKKKKKAKSHANELEPESENTKAGEKRKNLEFTPESSSPSKKKKRSLFNPSRDYLAEL